MLEWERGRLLKKFNENQYSYDGDGIRFRKDLSDGTVILYRTQGGKILHEIKGALSTSGENTLFTRSHQLWYFYDETGIAAMEYEGEIEAFNGKKFYFLKNAQGDVTEIVDKTGAIVAVYAYDAWGNHKIASPSLNCDITTGDEYKNEIGRLNPFRYRGYYFDEENGLYYLQTRYYDPVYGRFLNMDTVDYLAPETINGCNLYTYCGNNPVMYIDPTGHFSLLLFAFIGIVVSGVINGVVNVVGKEDDESAVGAFTGGFFEGAVSATALALGLAVGTASGGIGYAVLGGVIAVGGGYIGGKYGSAISQQISYGSVDWEVANINGGFSALNNLVSYVGLYVNADILSTSGKLGTRFLENVGPSTVGLGLSVYLASLPKPNLNTYRDEQRIKLGKGKFMWEYLF